MRFIDRESELEALNRLWRESASQLAIIYGKRRVGKTELIKRFIHGKPAAYFLAKRISEKDNLLSLGQVIGNFFNDITLRKRGFEKWEELFSYLRQRLNSKKYGRFVLAIDEFPYLAEANKGISSIFQAGWDECLRDSPIYLILCGSSIGMMEQETLAYKAPLYGRRTGQVFIRPLAFLQARKFFPRAAFEYALKAYSVAGGMPAYLLKISGYPSLARAVEEEVFTPERVLYEEIEFILKEELREPRNYFSVLKAIGCDCTKVSEIINETGLEKSALHNYLFVLEDLQLIEKRVPITEKNPSSSRKGRYYLKDQFFKFWFNYCFPFMGELEMGNKSPSLKAFRDSFGHILAQNYELAAQEILRRYQDRIFVFHKIGRWWDKNEEIDIVALNEQDREILFGEVKWSNKQVGTNIYDGLKQKAQKVDWRQGGRKERFCLFSKSGFTPNMLKVAKKEKVLLFVKDKLI